jgi:carbon storage regulator
MLVLSRKKDEEIFIETATGQIIIKVIEMDDKNVKLGITAPKKMPIYRKEVYERVYAVNQESAISPDIKGLDGLLEALKDDDR